MMKRKNILYSILFFAVVLAVYCLLFLVIPFPKPAASWISFGFTLAAICLSGAVFAYVFFGGKDLKSKLYGFPIMKIALIYAAVQLVSGIAVCIIAAFVNVPAWIPVVLYAIVLAVGVLGFLATDSAKTAIEELETSAENNTRTFTVLRVKIAGIIDVCSDAELCGKLKKLEERFRFSDPISCPETEEAESELVGGLGQLYAFVKEKKFAEASELTDGLGIRLSERNRLCKMYKK